MRLPFPALLAFACLGASTAAAQDRAPAHGGRVTSLGQPTTWRWTVGGAMGGAHRDGETAAVTELRLGTHRAVGNSSAGLGALQFEAFGGARGEELDGGARARLFSPFFRFGVGGEYLGRAERAQFFLTVTHPVLRGGLFRDGSQLRLDVVPHRNVEFRLAIEKPLQRHPPPGRTRPRSDHVPLSAARPVTEPLPTAPGVAEAIAEARERAAWIGKYVVPWLDHPGGNRARAEATVRAQVTALRDGLTTVDAAGVARPRLMEDEVRGYHRAVERAFAGALHGAPRVAASGRSEELAQRVAARARVILLDEVLLPYDRLLGQVKVEDTTNEFARRAQAGFASWLQRESGVPSDGWVGAVAVFGAVLAIVEDNRASIFADWKDSRLVWLPLQYGLLPEEHDTQEELDALVERATRSTFTEGNGLAYAINEQTQYHFARMVLEAREYHVLWIHDFRGIDDQKLPDEQSYRHVLNSYFRAMTERVRAYDSTGTFPTYMIMIDEWFYSWRKGRLWLDVLENPLRHEVKLPREFREWEDAIRAAQQELRIAIAGSRLLQAQRAQFGERWLRDLVKVHINVTNAGGWAFASRRLVPGITVADASLRDHRKLAFYDITEEDPYRGEAMYSGAGIGENYSNLTWEDRSLLVRGPAALSLKAAARQLLLEQGLDSTQIPWALRARPRGADYDARVAAEAANHRRTHRAVSSHNATGYGPKDVNVAKAVLYTLMPPGTVVKAPDSLWNSTFWGAAIAGCALRGGRVMVIAPATRSIPVPAFGSVQQSYELVWRLLLLSRELAPQLAERGGLLRVGVFNSMVPVNDIAQKIDSVQSVFNQQAWLRELYGFPPEVYTELAKLVATFARLEVPVDPDEFEDEGIPKLHPKANIFVSREAWTLMARREWIDMTWEFVQQRAAQVQERRTAVGSFVSFPDAMLDVGDGPVQAWYAELPDSTKERAVFFTMIGSHNQNGRSLVTDGEVVLTVSGWPAIIPYLDIISLTGLSRWITDPDDLAEFIPPKGGIQARIAHWARHVF